MQRLARFSYQRRRSVLAFWLVALVASIAIGSVVGAKYSQSFLISGSDSQRAAALLQSRFPARSGDAGQIVFSDAAGVRGNATSTRMRVLFADVSRVPGVTAVESPYTTQGVGQISTDGTVGYATIDFAQRANAIPSATVTAIENLTRQARYDSLRVELGGYMFQATVQFGPTELIGILAAVVILLVVFGSALAMGLPIIVALFGIGIGLSLLEIVSHLVTTPNFTTQLTSMIGIGVGIDYALFIVTRYRQSLHDGLEPEAAVVRAIDTAGRAVLFAGGTVVIAILGLLVQGVAFVQGLAVGTSVTVALVMAASVTLLPAILGFAGHGIDNLSVLRHRTREGAHRAGIWFRWSRLVQRRPWTAMLASLAVLIVLAVPLFSIRLGFADAGSNPTSDTTRQAYDLTAKGFGPGVAGPLTLAVEYPAGTDPTSALDAITTAVRNTPGVANVTAATRSPSGNAAVINVISKTSPQSKQTTTLVQVLRDRTIPDAIRGRDVVVRVGGLTAAEIDVSNRLSSRLPIFVAAVLALSFLLLLAVFRSVLVPLKAVVMNLLSIGAAYGIIVAVFQWGWLGSIVGISKPGPIAPFIPMMMFAILFGLSMDYEVFLLSRVREEYDRTHDNSLAVADGVASTARVITAAALIMVTVFGSFVTNSSGILKLFGLGLAVAIFIDATLVRMVLVPATMELLGDRNWWFPRRLERVVPHLHVEPTDDLHPDPELALLVEREHVGSASR